VGRQRRWKRRCLGRHQFGQLFVSQEFHVILPLSSLPRGADRVPPTVCNLSDGLSKSKAHRIWPEQAMGFVALNPNLRAAVNFLIGRPPQGAPESARRTIAAMAPPRMVHLRRCGPSIPY
jgi:hypothetical protein